MVDIHDIHPSHVLINLNALTHFAVIFRENPENLSAANGVPKNIVDIFKGVVWEVVTHNVRTGFTAEPITSSSALSEMKKIVPYPNPVEDYLNINI